jgi:hypothetical protein
MFKHKKISNNFLKFEILIVTKKFFNWIQGENTINFQVTRQLNLRQSLIWIFCKENISHQE